MLCMCACLRICACIRERVRVYLLYVYKLRRTTLLMEKLLKFNIHGNNNNNSSSSSNNNSYYYYNSSTMDSILFSLQSRIICYLWVSQSKTHKLAHTHLYSRVRTLNVCVCVPVQMTLVNAIWASARMSRHRWREWNGKTARVREKARTTEEERVRAGESKSTRSLLDWLHGMRTWGGTHTSTNTDSKWFITTVAFAVFTFYLFFLLLPPCSSMFFSSSRLPALGFFYFISLTIQNSLVHTFLTIYVLYFFPFFNFLSSNASLVSNTVQIVSVFS